MPNKRQLAIIHVAKKQLRLSEGEYRAILRTVAEVDSSKDLTSDAFSAVMGYFEYLGFEPLASAGEHYGERPGMATPAQVQLIRDLWREYQGEFDERVLDRWLSRTFALSSLRFANAPMVGKIICALRSMTTRDRKTG